jgi:DNA-binding NtrC family response regulator
MIDSKNNKAKILVVDDESIVRELFEKFLSKQGYEVILASGSKEALGKVERDEYDLVIIDLKMPQMNGVEFLKEVKRFRKDLIVIIVTGYATIEDAKDAITQGCFDYITKPFDIGEVSVVVKRALDTKRLWEEKRSIQQQYQVFQDMLPIMNSGIDIVCKIKDVFMSLKKSVMTEKNSEDMDIFLEKMENIETEIREFLDSDALKQLDRNGPPV